MSEYPIKEHVVAFNIEKPWCDINGELTEVVRCVDCQHNRRDYCSVAMFKKMGPNGFCSKGVRRNVEMDSQKNS